MTCKAIEPLNIIKKFPLSNEIKLHLKNTAEFAKNLATIYKCNAEKAYIGGFLHDLFKETDSLKLKSLAFKSKYTFDKSIKALWHGPACAFYLSRNKIITDEEILSAIAFHTTGSPSLSKVGLCIFVADLLEPSRKIEKLSNIRKKIKNMSLENLALKCAQIKLKYLLDNNKIIDIMALKFWNSLIIKNAEKET